MALINRSSNDYLSDSVAKAKGIYNRSLSDTKMEMERNGVDASSGRYAGLLSEVATRGAAGISGSVNDAMSNWYDYLADREDRQQNLALQNRGLDLQEQRNDISLLEYYNQLASDKQKAQQSVDSGGTSTGNNSVVTTPRKTSYTSGLMGGVYKNGSLLNAGRGKSAFSRGQI